MSAIKLFVHAHANGNGTVATIRETSTQYHSSVWVSFTQISWYIYFFIIKRLWMKWQILVGILVCTPPVYTIFYWNFCHYRIKLRLSRYLPVNSWQFSNCILFAYNLSCGADDLFYRQENVRLCSVLFVFSFIFMHSM